MDVAQLGAVSAVLGAIAASAGAGVQDAVKDSAKTAITRARDRLITLVRGHLKNDKVGDAKLTVYAAEPTPGNSEALAGHLVNSNIGADAKILDLAREILGTAGPAALGPGSVAATVIEQTNTHGGIGFIGGHHFHEHQHRE